MSEPRRGVRHAAAMALLAAVAAGCTPPAQSAAEKITALAGQQCHDGNQAACHTIVQAMTDTKVAIESTMALDPLTTDCNRGRQLACQQVAVLHVELSAWCAHGNLRACAAVNVGPWPTNWDEPALIDAAKLSCLSGQIKPDSDTCQALEYF